MKELSATEASRRFSEMLDAVEHRGERFVVTRGGRAVAAVGPVSSLTGRTLKDVLARHRPVDRRWAQGLRSLRAGLTSEERPWPD